MHEDVFSATYRKAPTLPRFALRGNAAGEIHPCMVGQDYCRYVFSAGSSRKSNQFFCPAKIKAALLARAVKVDYYWKCRISFSASGPLSILEFCPEFCSGFKLDGIMPPGSLFIRTLENSSPLMSILLYSRAFLFIWCCEQILMRWLIVEC